MRLHLLLVLTIVAGHASCTPRDAGPASDLQHDGAEEFVGVVEYDPVSDNLFPGYEDAKLIVNYWHTSGISWGSRYTYEIIVTDHVVRLSFHSPKTEDLNEVDFMEMRELTTAQVAELTRTIAAAHLTQLRAGAPRPTWSGSEQEVLIVRTPTLSVAGGRMNSTIFGAGTDEEMRQEIAQEHAASTTIGGDLEAVIKAAEMLFPELNHLFEEAKSGLRPAGPISADSELPGGW